MSYDSLKQTNPKTPNTIHLSKLLSRLQIRVQHPSNEVLKTSRAAYTARVNVSQETHRGNASAHDQSDGEDQSHHHSSLQTLQFQVAKGPNNCCDST